MTCSARFSLISTSKPFHSSTRISTIGPCAFSHGRAPSPTPRNRGHGISYAGAWPPAPCSRCRISPWPLRCSFRLGIHQLRRLLLVVRYQTLEDGPVTLGLALVVLAPRHPHLFAPAGGVGPHALLPQLLVLVGVYLTRPGAALDHAQQLGVCRFGTYYVHLNTPPFTLTAVLGEDEALECHAAPPSNALIPSRSSSSTMRRNANRLGSMCRSMASLTRRLTSEAGMASSSTVSVPNLCMKLWARVSLRVTG